MLIYLFKAIVCSGIFYSLYALLFNKEKMLVFNRFYLLGSLIASFLIPLITITVDAPVASQQPLSIYNDNLVNIQRAQEKALYPPNYINNSLIAVMILTSCYLLVRFVNNILQLVAKEKNNTSFYINRIKVVLLTDPIAPYSFLNTIYLSKAEYENGEIEAEVMAHEMAHLHQKHSWDLLLIELLKIFTWFNPFIYLYKRSVKINHELLADAAVVKQLGDVRSYQVVLLQRVAAQSSLALASSFTFYITQKRLTMLLKKRNRKRNALVSLTLIPVTALVVFIGCNTEEKKQTNLPANEQRELDRLQEDRPLSVSKDTAIALTTTGAQPATNDSAARSGLTGPPAGVKKMAPPKVVRDMPEGPGASPNELAAYEDIIRQIRHGKTNKYKWIEGKSDKLLPIYQKMTLEQRQKASELPPPPPPEIEVKKFSPPQVIGQNEPGAGHPVEPFLSEILRQNLQVIEAYYAANMSTKDKPN